jgi:hypothetical protein
MDEVRSALDRLQHSKSGCTPSTASVVRARGTNGHAGLASLVEQVAGALNGAFRNGTALVVRDFFDYFYHRSTKHRTMDPLNGTALAVRDFFCYVNHMSTSPQSPHLKPGARQAPNIGPSKDPQTTWGAYFDSVNHETCRGCPGKQLTHDDLACYFEPLFSAECSQVPQIRPSPFSPYALRRLLLHATADGPGFLLRGRISFLLL